MAIVKLIENQPLHTKRMLITAEPKLRRALMAVRGVLKKEIRINLSGKVLQKRSGLLRNSLESEIKMRKLGRFVSGGSLEMYIDLGKVPYARIHEHGGMTGRNHATKIPKRPYMKKALVAKKREIRRAMQRFVTRLVRG